MPAVATSTVISRTAYVAAARSLIGVKFRHQGRDPVTGLDCLGLAEYAAYLCGAMQPNEFSRGYTRWPDGRVLSAGLAARLVPLELTEVQPGDLYQLRFKRNPVHVAIAACAPDGTPTMIHALYTESGANDRVIEETLMRWHACFVGAYRWPEVIA